MARPALSERSVYDLYDVSWWAPTPESKTICTKCGKPAPVNTIILSRPWLSQVHEIYLFDTECPDCGFHRLETDSKSVEILAPGERYYRDVSAACRRAGIPRKKMIRRRNDLRQDPAVRLGYV